MYIKTAKPVKLPSERGKYQTYKSGYVYWYSYLRWDSEKKQPVDDRVCIGKQVEGQPGWIYPNKKFFELFGSPAENQTPLSEAINQLSDESQDGTIIDISMPVDDKTPVYPGDTPFTTRWLSTGDINTSEIKITPHVGTHVDAPFHFGYGSAGIGEAALDIFVGICAVVKVQTNASAVGLADVDLPESIPPRVLFAMHQATQGLSVELVNYLLKNGVKLIGVSTDSIDPSQCTDFSAHKAALSAGAYVLENLNLKKVKEGRYFLSAAPIRWLQAEASPVRAYLICLNNP